MYSNNWLQESPWLQCLFFIGKWSLRAALWLFLSTSALYFAYCFADDRVPFTKWCGAGKLAQHDNDLGVFGYFIQVDKCCKGHDHCPYYIAVNETKFSLTNRISYTISACDCDDKFQNCLKVALDDGHIADKVLAIIVGLYFFNYIEMPCFNFPQKFPQVVMNTLTNSIATIRNARTFEVL